MAQPLDGIRVLDLTRNVVGPYATKLLAEYGADVLKVEPPGGDPAREFGPFPDDKPHREASGLFLSLNTNKRSIALDPSEPDHAERLRRFALEADIVFEDFPPGRVAQWGIGWDQLSEGHRDLVMCSITPFGQSGPYRDYRGSEITLQAVGGPMHLNGHADREPLKLGGHAAMYHAGAAAAYAALLARRGVERGGDGDHIDLAIYECQAGSRDRRTIYLTAAAYTGFAPKRGGTDVIVASGVRPTQDGYIDISGAGSRLPLLLAMIGREDLLAHPDIDKPMGLAPPELAEEIEDSYLKFLLSRGKLEALAETQAHRMPSGAILTTADLLKDPHYRGRGVWETIEHPQTGPLEYPGRQWLMSASARPGPSRAPLLDEHADEVRKRGPWSSTATKGAERRADSGQRGPRPAAALPLAGVRVADITLVWAGPAVTQMLAEWGAEVIRVEPVTTIQPGTRGAEQTLTSDEARQLAEQGRLVGAYPGFDPKHDRWNRSPSFNAHARNKKSMACDVMTAEGREAFLRLIAASDVFVENNVPETIEKAGITWEALRQVNPRLVMLRMPAFGLNGPYKNYRAFGHQAEGMIGHHHLRGYPDAGPEYTGSALTADGFAGILGAVAVMMGLRHRDRSGEGQQIEMPLAEAFIPVLAEFVLDYSMNGRTTPPQGNTHPHHAPHNVYPTAGDDQWIAIDVGSDVEFAALCRVLGVPALPEDERFRDASSRHAHREELDHAIAAVTRLREKEELFHSLQAEGVTAAPLHDELEALADEQLEARRWFREIDVAGLGRHRYPGYLFKMERTPDDVRLPPPRLGEHNEEIYLDLLGYSREQFDSLVERRLVGTTYAPEALPQRRS